MVDFVIFAEKRKFARGELSSVIRSQFFCYFVSTHLTFEGVNCGSAIQILEFVDFDELGIVIHSDQVIASFPFEDVSRYLDPRQVGFSLGLSVSTCCLFWYVLHAAQSLTRFSICSVIPGQNSASRARCLHFVMLKCDSGICASMLGLMLGGTTILMPLYTTPSDTESSSRIVQYIQIGCGVSCFVSGQPFRVIACSSFSSSAVHPWNWLYRVGVTAMKLIILTMTGSISGTASGRWARLSASRWFVRHVQVVWLQSQQHCL